MQTFLPYPSFARSAAVLDSRRLGKQRVEALQILRALHLEDYGWQSHPAVLMWRGCTRALVAYGLAVVDQWLARGHSDATRPLIGEFAHPRAALGQDRLPAAESPPWLGDVALHRSHQAALVRKDPGFYGAVFPGVDPGQPYVWPGPPAGPAVRPAFSAWAVRARSDAVVRAFRASGLVGLPASFGTGQAAPKQRRQSQRFHHGVAVGDLVVVASHADSLDCAVVAGSPVERSVAGIGYVTRDVVWRGEVARRSLRRPYQLQNPQALFALRGERAVAQAVEAAPRPASARRGRGVDCTDAGQDGRRPEDGRSNRAR